MSRSKVGRFIDKYNVDTNYDLYFTTNGYQNVQTYFGNLAKGNDKVWTAPFAKGDAMSKILKDWHVILESIQDKWPTLCEFENDLASKVGPLSIQLPIRDRLDDIRHYWDDILLSSKPIDPRAIKAVISELKSISPISPRTQKRTVENMKLSSQAGSPFWQKRRDVVQDSVPCTTKTYNDFEVAQNLPNFKGLGCAMVGWRGQEGGPSEEDVKQRVIWMFPFAVNVCELQMYQPIIEGCQRRNLIPAWVSMDEVDRSITRLFDSKSSNDLIICTDFSKFDQHFNSTLQNAAKTIIAGLCTRNRDATDWLDNVYPIKYQIPLCWDIQSDGWIGMFRGHHGMASGSGGTNVDETLAHKSLQYEVAMLHGKKLNPNSQCLGDDGILSYPGITVEDVVEAYSSHGQECNVDKQYASTQDCIYLRRWHHDRYRVNGICVGVYSTCRALGRLRYLERYMNPKFWDEKMVALRQLSIIENCKWHPLFHEFIQFCMKRDKYRLGIDIPGFLDSITDEAKKAVDHMPDFLGYTKTLQGESAAGISEWEVVKYLKSAR